MTLRQRLIQSAGVLLAAVLAALGARYGIEVPPPVVPPPVVTVPPPVIVPPAPERPRPSPLAAIARIQFGASGCTATVIGPRQPDGTWYALTAAHCVTGPGQRGSMRMRSGQTSGVVVRSVDKRADAAWIQTESNGLDLPYAELADSAPPVGSRVWHAGYGVDMPGNREEGTVEADTDQNGQIRFRLSVSSGDSGGGIVMDSTGRVVSCVCCTTARGQVASVWGAGPDAIHRLLPTALAHSDWTPVELPTRPAP